MFLSGPNYTQSYGSQVGIISSAGAAVSTSGTLSLSAVATSPSFGMTVASNAVTIGQTGLYLFTFKLAGAPPSTTASNVTIRATRSSVIVGTSPTCSTLPATTAVVLDPSIVISCTAGDVITFTIYAAAADFTYTTSSKTFITKLA